MNLSQRAGVRRGGLVGALRGPQSEADHIGVRVGELAKQAAPAAAPGMLQYLAPLMFVAERATIGVLKLHKLPADRGEDVEQYLLAALQEYVVAVAGEFDVNHFEAWTAAQDTVG